jgi:hypothetical protein
VIFVDKTTEEWVLKYPELKVITKACDSCGKLIIANKPFLEKGYAGLYGGKCPCGKNRFTAMSMVTTSDESADSWRDCLNID